MARPKKDGVNINYYIRRDIKEKLDLYCEEKGQTATMALERILSDYLDNYFETRGIGDLSSGCTKGASTSCETRKSF